MASGRRELLILGGAGLAAGIAGFLVGPALLRLGSDAEGEALRSARFTDLKGKARRLSDWGGQVLVCNFWATWCAPCREEIPLLVAAKAKYAAFGVEIVGIAVDNAIKVKEFSESFKITYPILLSEADGLELMRRLGNTAGGLPYTVVADRKGNPVRHKLGALKQGELDALLDPVLAG